MCREAQRPVVYSYLLDAGKKEEKKIEMKKITLFAFPKLGATFRVRTGGQKLFAVAQPFLSCLPALRSFTDLLRKTPQVQMP